MSEHTMNGQEPTHETATDHLLRAMALAKLMRALVRQHMRHADPTDPLTVTDLKAWELDLVYEIMLAELDLALEEVGPLAPGEAS